MEVTKTEVDQPAKLIRSEESIRQLTEANQENYQNEEAQEVDCKSNDDVNSYGLTNTIEQ